MKYTEDLFTFYNQSSRVEVEQRRLLFEKWFSTYPEPLKKRFISQFRTHMKPAFFELFVRELLISTGFAVEVEPSVGSGQTPDFCATRGKSKVYIECATSSVDSSTEKLSDKLFNELVDYLNNTLQDTLFFGWLETQNKGSTPIKVSEVRKQCITAMDVGSEQIMYTQDDWKIEIKFLKKTEPKRTRFVCSTGVETNWIGNDPFIRFQKTIRTKASAYSIEAPFIIAVNLEDWAVELPMEAKITLFGERTFGLDPIFTASKGTRVSAVLFFKDIGPDSPWNREYVLIENPFCTVKLPQELFTFFDRVVSSSGKLVFKKGKLLKHLIPLPSLA